MSKKLKAAVLASVFILAAFALTTLARDGDNKKHLGEIKTVEKTENAVQVRCENGLVRISARSEGLLHIEATGKETFDRFPSFALENPEAEGTAPEVTENDKAVVLEKGDLKVRIDRGSGSMEILLGEEPLLSEPERGGVFFQGDTVGCIKKMPDNEHYYGFGEKTGPLDKRGERLVMWNTDVGYDLDTDPIYQSHPFFLALREGRAYGLFFDNTFRSVFDMGRIKSGRYSFQAGGGELDYWVIAGPAPKEVLSRYGDLVGTMPLPPLWGIGYHQCRYSYKDAEEVREIKKGFLEHDIPVDAIYLDIHYMEGYRVFTFDPESFPDPAGLTAELEKHGIKTVAIVDPGIKIDKEYEPYSEGMANDYFVRDKEGGLFQARVWPGDVYFPDFYKPEVRKWWGSLHRFYTSRGVDGIWNDMNEPAGWAEGFSLGKRININWGEVNWLRMRHGQASEPIPHARVHNIYALLEAEGTWQGLRELNPSLRPFIISRAGFPGIQRHALVWTGDNSSEWSHLGLSIPMQLNMGLSGIAFNGSDVGGFHGYPSDEMFARWVEAGAFYPFFRNHTGNNMPDQEPWEFGDKITAIARKAIKLRYRLMPYTYTLFEQTSRTNHPVMRPMLFEFPADPAVLDMDDQFMWGKWLLAAPVLEKGKLKRSVYLPKGEWYDFYTGEKIKGPAEIQVPAPLSETPLFAKAGAIVPMTKGEKTESAAWKPLTLRVYPGRRSSSFVLYEDDGRTMAHEKGSFTRTEFSCRPVAGGVEIGIKKLHDGYDTGRESVEFRVYGLPESADIRLRKDGESTPCPAASYDRGNKAWLIQVPAGEKESSLIIKEGKE
ncbi:MAG: glycoside hydrolase family 31 protein [bacterium]